MGIDPKVSALVYVAARGPDAGEDFTALAKTFPTAPAGAGLVETNGFAQLSEHAFLVDFANGVDQAKARVLYAVQGPVSATLFSGKTTAAGWRSEPSWYAVSKQDRTISPELERFLAKRMNATLRSVPSSHCPFMSKPEAVADIIALAAEAIDK